MGWWQKLFNQPSPAPMADQRLTTLVTMVLHQHRFLGEVLLQLPRQLVTTQRAAIGLAWQEGMLTIQVNPVALGQLRDDEACLLLAHQALHVVWAHPVRYANYPHPDLVKLATDAAVNQYLPATPPGTVDLGQLERLLRKKLPVKQDSQEYLTILENASPAERDRLRAAGFKLNGDRPGKQTAPGKVAPNEETHAGWASAQNTNLGQQVQLVKLRRLVQQAWQQTPQRDRGLLPGAVRQQLTGSTPPVATPLWRSLLRRQLGNIAAGKHTSFARFNRRQPLRMDLPGQVSRLVPDVYIFVDNSGSVPDEELQAALTAVDQLTRNYRLGGIVYHFDAKVNSHGQQLRPGLRVNRERHGGGGTSFQSIFDFLQAQRVNRRAVVVVITDGFGEATLRDHHYQNVDWLLTTDRHQLSVLAPGHRVFELTREDFQ